MSLCDALKYLRHEEGVSKHIPYSHLISPTMAETKDGCVLSVIKVKGVAYLTQTDEALNQYQFIWQKILSSLDERVCVYVTVHRHKVDHQLKGEFKEAFTKQLNDKYMSNFEHSQMFTNDIYMTVMFRGIHSGKFGAGIKFFNALNKKVIHSAKQTFREKSVLALRKICSRMVTMLAEFRPQLLGEQDDQHKVSELITFLALTVNGGIQNPIKSHQAAPKIRHSIKQHTQHRYPQASLSQYLPLRRIFFGNNIQFNGVLDEQNAYAGILSIKSYPNESHPLIMSMLLQLPCEWICTHSFAIESKTVAIKKAKLQVTKLQNVSDPGETQVSQLSQLPDLVQSNSLTLGYYHNTLMVISDTLSNLNDQLDQAAKCYIDSGIPVIKETIGQEPAFWAQLPGNLAYIARSSMITSDNFCDFCPLFHEPIGYCDRNHLGGAVALLETSVHTPYFFNFHLQGDSRSLTPGHSLIIGSNGAGKTVLMTFLDAQLSRYDLKSVFFDRDQGTRRYIHACDGSYLTLSPKHMNATSFNPLQLENTAENRHFCLLWLSQLCMDDKGVPLSSYEQEILKTALDYTFETLEKKYRQLSHLVSIIPRDFSRWPQLRRWIRGDHQQTDGQYAYIFDNPCDALSCAKKVGFDMTHFLDNEPSQVRTAVMMYLLHWIQLQLDGTLCAIYLDEAWQYFHDFYWVAALKKIIPTFRKRNAFIVMATQSAKNITQSDLTSTIVDNCATQIFFPNPNADEQIYIHQLGLTESELHCLKSHLPQSRLFMVKQSGQSTLCRLNLSHMNHELKILSTNVLNKSSANQQQEGT